MGLLSRFLHNMGSCKGAHGGLPQGSATVKGFRGLRGSGYMIRGFGV